MIARLILSISFSEFLQMLIELHNILLEYLEVNSLCEQILQDCSLISDIADLILD